MVGSYFLYHVWCLIFNSLWSAFAGALYLWVDNHASIFQAPNLVLVVDIRHFGVKGM